MMTVLLVVLLVCHYLADFCLTLPMMIRAKSDGRNVCPILLHASVHAMLMGVCLLLFGVAWRLLLIMMLIELVPHFVIDVAKARLSVAVPILADTQRKPYWMLYGFDQLLHLLVLVTIWNYVCFF